MKKLYSVKGFQYEEKQKVVVLDATNANKKLPPPTYVRKLSLIAKDLSFSNAKKIRDDNRKFGAEIFPNVKSPQLQVIQLSEPV